MEDKYKEKTIIDRYWNQYLREPERKAIVHAYDKEGYCALEGLPLGYTEFALKLLFHPKQSYWKKDLEDVPPKEKYSLNNDFKLNLKWKSDA